MIRDRGQKLKEKRSNIDDEDYSLDQPFNVAIDLPYKITTMKTVVTTNTTVKSNYGVNNITDNIIDNFTKGIRKIYDGKEKNSNFKFQNNQNQPKNIREFTNIREMSTHFNYLVPPENLDLSSKTSFSDNSSTIPTENTTLSTDSSTVLIENSSTISSTNTTLSSDSCTVIIENSTATSSENTIPPSNLTTSFENTLLPSNLSKTDLPNISQSKDSSLELTENTTLPNNLSTKNLEDELFKELSSKGSNIDSTCLTDFLSPLRNSTLSTIKTTSSNETTKIESLDVLNQKSLTSTTLSTNLSTKNPENINMQDELFKELSAKVSDVDSTCITDFLSPLINTNLSTVDISTSVNTTKIESIDVSTQKSLKSHKSTHSLKFKSPKAALAPVNIPFDTSIFTQEIPINFAEVSSFSESSQPHKAEGASTAKESEIIKLDKILSEQSLEAKKTLPTFPIKTGFPEYKASTKLNSLTTSNKQKTLFPTKNDLTNIFDKSNIDLNNLHTSSINVRQVMEDLSPKENLQNFLGEEQISTLTVQNQDENFPTSNPFFSNIQDNPYPFSNFASSPSVENVFTNIYDRSSSQVSDFQLLEDTPSSKIVTFNDDLISFDSNNPSLDLNFVKSSEFYESDPKIVRADYSTDASFEEASTALKTDVQEEDSLASEMKIKNSDQILDELLTFNPGVLHLGTTSDKNNLQKIDSTYDSKMDNNVDLGSADTSSFKSSSENFTTPLDDVMTNRESTVSTVVTNLDDTINELTNFLKNNSKIPIQTTNQYLTSTEESQFVNMEPSEAESQSNFIDLTPDVEIFSRNADVFNSTEESADKKGENAGNIKKPILRFTGWGKKATTKTVTTSSSDHTDLTSSSTIFESDATSDKEIQTTISSTETTRRLHANTLAEPLSPSTINEMLVNDFQASLSTFKSFLQEKFSSEMTPTKNPRTTEKTEIVTTTIPPFNKNLTTKGATHKVHVSGTDRTLVQDQFTFHETTEKEQSSTVSSKASEVTVTDQFGEYNTLKIGEPKTIYLRGTSPGEDSEDMNYFEDEKDLKNLGDDDVEENVFKLNQTINRLNQFDDGFQSVSSTIGHFNNTSTKTVETSSSSVSSKSPTSSTKKITHSTFVIDIKETTGSTKENTINSSKNIGTVVGSTRAINISSTHASTHSTVLIDVKTPTTSSEEKSKISTESTKHTTVSSTKSTDHESAITQNGRSSTNIDHGITGSTTSSVQSTKKILPEATTFSVVDHTESIKTYISKNTLVSAEFSVSPSEFDMKTDSLKEDVTDTTRLVFSTSIDLNPITTSSSELINDHSETKGLSTLLEITTSKNFDDLSSPNLESTKLTTGRDKIVSSTKSTDHESTITQNGRSSTNIDHGNTGSTTPSVQSTNKILAEATTFSVVDHTESIKTDISKNTLVSAEFSVSPSEFDMKTDSLKEDVTDTTRLDFSTSIDLNPITTSSSELINDHSETKGLSTLLEITTSTNVDDLSPPNLENVATELKSSTKASDFFQVTQKIPILSTGLNQETTSYQNEMISVTDQFSSDTRFSIIGQDIIKNTQESENTKFKEISTEVSAEFPPFEVAHTETNEQSLSPNELNPTLLTEKYWKPTSTVFNEPSFPEINAITVDKSTSTVLFDTSSSSAPLKKPDIYEATSELPETRTEFGFGSHSTSFESSHWDINSKITSTSFDTFSSTNFEEHTFTDVPPNKTDVTLFIPTQPLTALVSKEPAELLSVPTTEALNLDLLGTSVIGGSHPEYTTEESIGTEVFNDKFKFTEKTGSNEIISASSSTVNQKSTTGLNTLAYILTSKESEDFDSGSTNGLFNIPFSISNSNHEFKTVTTTHSTNKEHSTKHHKSLLTHKTKTTSESTPTHNNTTHITTKTTSTKPSKKHKSTNAHSNTTSHSTTIHNKKQHTTVPLDYTTRSTATHTNHTTKKDHKEKHTTIPANHTTNAHKEHKTKITSTKNHATKTSKSTTSTTTYKPSSTHQSSIAIPIIPFIITSKEPLTSLEVDLKNVLVTEVSASTIHTKFGTDVIFSTENKIGDASNFQINQNSITSIPLVNQQESLTTEFEQTTQVKPKSTVGTMSNELSDVHEEFDSNELKNFNTSTPLINEQNSLPIDIEQTTQVKSKNTLSTLSTELIDVHEEFNSSKMKIFNTSTPLINEQKSLPIDIEQTPQVKPKSTVGTMSNELTDVHEEFDSNELKNFNTSTPLINEQKSLPIDIEQTTQVKPKNTLSTLSTELIDVHEEFNSSEMKIFNTSTPFVDEQKSLPIDIEATTQVKPKNTLSTLSTELIDVHEEFDSNELKNVNTSVPLIYEQKSLPTSIEQTTQVKPKNTASTLSTELINVHEEFDSNKLQHFNTSVLIYEQKSLPTEKEQNTQVTLKNTVSSLSTELTDVHEEFDSSKLQNFSMSIPLVNEHKSQSTETEQITQIKSKNTVSTLSTVLIDVHEEFDSNKVQNFSTDKKIPVPTTLYNPLIITTMEQETFSSTKETSTHSLPLFGSTTSHTLSLEEIVNSKEGFDFSSIYTHSSDEVLATTFTINGTFGTVVAEKDEYFEDYIDEQEKNREEGRTKSTHMVQTEKSEPHTEIIPGLSSSSPSNNQALNGISHSYLDATEIPHPNTVVEVNANHIDLNQNSTSEELSENSVNVYQTSPLIKVGVTSDVEYPSTVTEVHLNNIEVKNATSQNDNESDDILNLKRTSTLSVDYAEKSVSTISPVDISENATFDMISVIDNMLNIFSSSAESTLTRNISITNPKSSTVSESDFHPDTSKATTEEVSRDDGAQASVFLETSTDVTKHTENNLTSSEEYAKTDFTISGEEDSSSTVASEEKHGTSIVNMEESSSEESSSEDTTLEFGNNENTFETTKIYMNTGATTEPEENGLKYTASTYSGFPIFEEVTKLSSDITFDTQGTREKKTDISIITSANSFGQEDVTSTESPGEETTTNKKTNSNDKELEIAHTNMHEYTSNTDDSDNMSNINFIIENDEKKSSTTHASTLSDASVDLTNENELTTVSETVESDVDEEKNTDHLSTTVGSSTKVHEITTEEQEETSDHLNITNKKENFSKERITNEEKSSTKHDHSTSGLSVKNHSGVTEKPPSTIKEAAIVSDGTFNFKTSGEHIIPTSKTTEAAQNRINTTFEESTVYKTIENEYPDAKTSHTTIRTKLHKITTVTHQLENSVIEVNDESLHLSHSSPTKTTQEINEATSPDNDLTGGSSYTSKESGTEIITLGEEIISVTKSSTLQTKPEFSHNTTHPGTFMHSKSANETPSFSFTEHTAESTTAVRPSTNTETNTFNNQLLSSSSSINYGEIETTFTTGGANSEGTRNESTVSRKDTEPTSSPKTSTTITIEIKSTSTASSTSAKPTSSSTESSKHTEENRASSTSTEPSSFNTESSVIIGESNTLSSTSNMHTSLRAEHSEHFEESGTSTITSTELTSFGREHTKHPEESSASNSTRTTSLSKEHSEHPEKNRTYSSTSTEPSSLSAEHSEHTERISTSKSTRTEPPSLNREHSEHSEKSSTSSRTSAETTSLSAEHTTHTKEMSTSSSTSAKPTSLSSEHSIHTEEIGTSSSTRADLTSLNAEHRAHTEKNSTSSSTRSEPTSLSTEHSIHTEESSTSSSTSNKPASLRKEHTDHPEENSISRSTSTEASSLSAEHSEHTKEASTSSSTSYKSTLLTTIHSENTEVISTSSSTKIEPTSLSTEHIMHTEEIVTSSSTSTKPSSLSAEHSEHTEESNKPSSFSIKPISLSVEHNEKSSTFSSTSNKPTSVSNEQKGHPKENSTSSTISTEPTTLNTEHSEHPEESGTKTASASLSTKHGDHHGESGTSSSTSAESTHLSAEHLEHTDESGTKTESASLVTERSEHPEESSTSSRSNAESTPLSAKHFEHTEGSGTKSISASLSTKHNDHPEESSTSSSTSAESTNLSAKHLEHTEESGTKTVSASLSTEHSKHPEESSTSISTSAKSTHLSSKHLEHTEENGTKTASASLSTEHGEHLEESGTSSSTSAESTPLSAEHLEHTEVSGAKSVSASLSTKHSEHPEESSTSISTNAESTHLSSEHLEHTEENGTKTASASLSTEHGDHPEESSTSSSTSAESTNLSTKHSEHPEESNTSSSTSAESTNLSAKHLEHIEESGTKTVSASLSTEHSKHPEESSTSISTNAESTHLSSEHLEHTEENGTKTASASLSTEHGDHPEESSTSRSTSAESTPLSAEHLEHTEVSGAKSVSASLSTKHSEHPEESSTSISTSSESTHLSSEHLEHTEENGTKTASASLSTEHGEHPEESSTSSSTSAESTNLSTKHSEHPEESNTSSSTSAESTNLSAKHLEHTEESGTKTVSASLSTEHSKHPEESSTSISTSAESTHLSSEHLEHTEENGTKTASASLSTEHGEHPEESSTSSSTSAESTPLSAEHLEHTEVSGAKSVSASLSTQHSKHPEESSTSISTSAESTHLSAEHFEHAEENGTKTASASLSTEHGEHPEESSTSSSTSAESTNLSTKHSEHPEESNTSSSTSAESTNLSAKHLEHTEESGTKTVSASLSTEHSKHPEESSTSISTSAESTHLSSEHLEHTEENGTKTASASLSTEHGEHPEESSTSSSTSAESTPLSAEHLEHTEVSGAKSVSASLSTKHSEHPEESSTSISTSAESTHLSAEHLEHTEENGTKTASASLSTEHGEHPEESSTSSSTSAESTHLSAEHLEHTELSGTKSVSSSLSTKHSEHPEESSTFNSTSAEPTSLSTEHSEHTEESNTSSSTRTKTTSLGTEHTIHTEESGTSSSTKTALTSLGTEHSEHPEENSTFNGTTASTSVSTEHGKHPEESSTSSSTNAEPTSLSTEHSEHTEESSTSSSTSNKTTLSKEHTENPEGSSAFSNTSTKTTLSKEHSEHPEKSSTSSSNVAEPTSLSAEHSEHTEESSAASSISNKPTYLSNERTIHSEENSASSSTINKPTSFTTEHSVHTEESSTSSSTSNKPASLSKEQTDHPEGSSITSSTRTEPYSSIGEHSEHTKETSTSSSTSYKPTLLTTIHSEHSDESSTSSSSFTKPSSTEHNIYTEVKIASSSTIKTLTKSTISTEKSSFITSATTKPTSLSAVSNTHIEKGDITSTSIKTEAKSSENVHLYSGKSTDRTSSKQTTKESKSSSSKGSTGIEATHSTHPTKIGSSVHEMLNSHTTITGIAQHHTETSHLELNNLRSSTHKPIGSTASKNASTKSGKSTNDKEDTEVTCELCDQTIEENMNHTKTTHSPGKIKSHTTHGTILKSNEVISTISHPTTQLTTLDITEFSTISYVNQNEIGKGELSTSERIHIPKVNKATTIEEAVDNLLVTAFSSSPMISTKSEIETSEHKEHPEESGTSSSTSTKPTTLSTKHSGHSEESGTKTASASLSTEHGEHPEESSTSISTSAESTHLSSEHLEHTEENGTKTASASLSTKHGEHPEESSTSSSTSAESTPLSAEHLEHTEVSGTKSVSASLSTKHSEHPEESNTSSSTSAESTNLSAKHLEHTEESGTKTVSASLSTEHTIIHTGTSKMNGRTDNLELGTITSTLEHLESPKDITSGSMESTKLPDEVTVHKIDVTVLKHPSTIVEVHSSDIDLSHHSSLSSNEQEENSSLHEKTSSVDREHMSSTVTPGLSNLHDFNISGASTTSNLITGLAQNIHTAENVNFSTSMIDSFGTTSSSNHVMSTKSENGNHSTAIHSGTLETNAGIDNLILSTITSTSEHLESSNGVTNSSMESSKLPVEVTTLKIDVTVLKHPSTVVEMHPSDLDSSHRSSLHPNERKESTSLHENTSSVDQEYMSSVVTSGLSDQKYTPSTFNSFGTTSSPSLAMNTKSEDSKQSTTIHSAPLETNESGDNLLTSTIISTIEHLKTSKEITSGSMESSKIPEQPTAHKVEVTGLKQPSTVVEIHPSDIDLKHHISSSPKEEEESTSVHENASSLGHEHMSSKVTSDLSTAAAALTTSNLITGLAQNVYTVENSSMGLSITTHKVEMTGGKVHPSGTDLSHHISLSPHEQGESTSIHVGTSIHEGTTYLSEDHLGNIGTTALTDNHHIHSTRASTTSNLNTGLAQNMHTVENINHSTSTFEGKSSTVENYTFGSSLDISTTSNMNLLNTSTQSMDDSASHSLSSTTTTSIITDALKDMHGSTTSSLNGTAINSSIVASENASTASATNVSNEHSFISLNETSESSVEVMSGVSTTISTLIENVIRVLNNTANSLFASPETSMQASTTTSLNATNNILLLENKTYLVDNTTGSPLEATNFELLHATTGASLIDTTIVSFNASIINYVGNLLNGSTTSFSNNTTSIPLNGHPINLMKGTTNTRASYGTSETLLEHSLELTSHTSLPHGTAVNSLGGMNLSSTSLINHTSQGFPNDSTFNAINGPTTEAISTINSLSNISSNLSSSTAGGSADSDYDNPLVEVTNNPFEDIDVYSTNSFNSTTGVTSKTMVPPSTQPSLLPDELGNLITTNAESNYQKNSNDGTFPTEAATVPTIKPVLFSNTFNGTTQASLLHKIENLISTKKEEIKPVLSTVKNFVEKLEKNISTIFGQIGEIFKTTTMKYPEGENNLTLVPLINYTSVELEPVIFYFTDSSGKNLSKVIDYKVVEKTSTTTTRKSHKPHVHKTTHGVNDFTQPHKFGEVLTLAGMNYSNTVYAIILNGSATARTLPNSSANKKMKATSHAKTTIEETSGTTIGMFSKLMKLLGGATTPSAEVNSSESTTCTCPSKHGKNYRRKLTTPAPKEIYINLPTFFPNSTVPILNFEKYYTTENSTNNEVDDELTDVTINLKNFKINKLRDFDRITEFQTTENLTSTVFFSAGSFESTQQIDIGDDNKKLICNFDNNSRKSCICSVDKLVKDLQEKSKGKQLNSTSNYMCEVYIPMTNGIKVGNSEQKKHRRRKRSLDYFDEPAKRQVIQNTEIETALAKDFEWSNTDVDRYVQPGSRVKIPCAVGKNMSTIYYTIKWTANQGLPLTEGKIEETGSGYLIIDNVVPQDGGNYTCTVTNNSTGIRTFKHQLFVITLPKFDINTTILYDMRNRTCQTDDVEVVKLYFTTEIADLICGKENKICSSEIKEIECVKKYDKTNVMLFISLVYHVETMDVIIPSLNTTICDVVCQMKVYAKLVSVIINNIEVFQTQPVIYHQGRDVVMVPTHEVSSHVTTEPPKLIVGCPPGFGIMTDRHICLACPPNTYSAGSEAFCTPCPRNQYQPNVGSKSCLVCTSPLQDSNCMIYMIMNGEKFKILALSALGVVSLICIVCFYFFCRKSDEKETKSRSVQRNRRGRHHSTDVERQRLLNDSRSRSRHSKTRNDPSMPPSPPPPDF